MPDLGKVLKDEIARISRKESKAARTPLQAASVRARKDIADLKRRMASLEKTVKQLQASLGATAPAAPVAAQEDQQRGWISGKGVKSLRKRLGLSQSQLANLVGVTTQAVYLWERKSGMLKPRKATLAAVLAARNLTATEARTRLEKIENAAKAKKPAKKRGK